MLIVRIRFHLPNVIFINALKTGLFYLLHLQSRQKSSIVPSRLTGYRLFNPAKLQQNTTVLRLNCGCKFSNRFFADSHLINRRNNQPLKYDFWLPIINPSFFYSEYKSSNLRSSIYENELATTD